MPNVKCHLIKKLIVQTHTQTHTPWTECSTWTIKMVNNDEAGEICI